MCRIDLKALIVGEAGTCREAADVITLTDPDVVLLDLYLPDGDGFSLAELVSARLPRCRLIALSSHCDDYTVFRVEQLGFAGFVDKNSQTVAALRAAFDAVARGDRFFSDAYQRVRAERSQDPFNFSKVLSRRECAVLSLIGEAMTDDEIARRLDITPTTAQTHRSHIMRKLGVFGTPKLIHFAITRGFTAVRVRGHGPAAFSP